MTATAPTHTPKGTTPTTDGRMVTVQEPQANTGVTTNMAKKNYHTRQRRDLWAAACEKADNEGRSISEVIEELLIGYITR